MQKSVCSYLPSLHRYKGGQVDNATQEEMYYKILSNHPEISYTL